MIASDEHLSAWPTRWASAQQQRASTRVVAALDQSQLSVQ